jgi:hypothetical protein
MEEHSYLRLRLLAALVSLAAATGCSGTSARDPSRAKGMDSVGRASSTGGSPCALISQSEVSAIVGNPVDKGEDQGGSTCKWDTPNPQDVSVLLIVHPKGDTSEPYLCLGLQDRGGEERLDGLDVASWKFSELGVFNSGDFEGCGPKGYLSLQLSGKREATQLKEAAFALAREVLND